MQCHSSATVNNNVPVMMEIVFMEPVPFPCLDESSIENHVNVCSTKVSKSSLELDEHLLITNGSGLDKSFTISKETQIQEIAYPLARFPKSKIA